MPQPTINRIGIKGQYRFKRYAPSKDSLTDLPLDKREVLEVSDWHKNLVVYSDSHGLGLISRLLVGVNTYPIEITQLKIGTGTTAPVAANTDLETTVTSGIIRATQSYTPTIATMEFFIANADLPNGTYTELGIFCGNQLFARSLISPSFTKATNEDVGIEYILTLSNT